MSNGNGPWGGGGNGGGSNGGPGGRPPRRPDDMPDIDDLMNRGRERLQGIMGGKGGSDGGGSGPDLPGGGRMFAVLALLGAGVIWAVNSFYTVRPDERSVEFFLGKYSQTGQPGLNFAPWPVVTKEVVAVSTERTNDIGTSRSGPNAGLMLTGDENIVDIDFQVVWNITDPAKFLFNLADPETTIKAVAESAMREIIAQSELGPILNTNRRSIAERLKDLIQETLDSYDSGVNVVRVNFDKADPPEPVIAAFRDVQDAEAEREKLQNDAQAYANKVVAEARGRKAQVLEGAEAYRAQVVNEAEGEASRFAAVLEEYAKAPEVTRKRLYLETMEQVLGGMDLTILGQESGAVPYLPLGEMGRRNGGSN